MDNLNENLLTEWPHLRKSVEELLASKRILRSKKGVDASKRFEWYQKLQQQIDAARLERAKKLAKPVAEAAISTDSEKIIDEHEMVEKEHAKLMKMLRNHPAMKKTVENQVKEDTELDEAAGFKMSEKVSWEKREAHYKKTIRAENKAKADPTPENKKNARNHRIHLNAMDKKRNKEIADGKHERFYSPMHGGYVREGIELNEAVDESWFKSGSFETHKNAVPIKHEVAKAAGTVDTLEGKVAHEKGHHIITGPKGEKYPVAPEKFKSLYDDHGDGTATPKKIVKQAKLADHDGEIKTSWGNLEYKKGEDYVVRHGEGDYGVVKKDIFHKTYNQDHNTIKEEYDSLDEVSLPKAAKAYGQRAASGDSKKALNTWEHIRRRFGKAGMRAADREENKARSFTVKEDLDEGVSKEPKITLHQRTPGSWSGIHVNVNGVHHFTAVKTVGPGYWSIYKNDANHTPLRKGAGSKTELKAVIRDHITTHGLDEAFDMNLDEGFASKLATGALAGAMALGSAHAGIGQAFSGAIAKGAASTAASSVVHKNKNKADDEFAQKIPDANDRAKFQKLAKSTKYTRSLKFAGSGAEIENAVKEHHLSKLKKEMIAKHGIKEDLDEARQSVAVRLSNAWDRQRAKSDASIKRAKELLNQPKAPQAEKPADNKDCK